jgi:hypothetical protein
VPIVTTEDIKTLIYDMYDIIKPITVEDGIYVPLCIMSRHETPHDGIGIFCFVEDNKYYIRKIEGKRCFEKISTDINEIAYHAMYDNIFTMSVSYEAKNRVLGQDSRRIIFSKRIELFSMISPILSNMIRHKIEETLKIYPYDDNINYWNIIK